jgi:hypothetical protein
VTGSERFLGVLGYAPRHVETLEQLGEDDRSRLRGLAGQRLVRHWAMWDGEAWFPDGPVVLEFEAARLELAAFKLHVCLSWGSIDVAQDLDWFGTGLRLEWRAEVLQPLAALRDPLTDVLAVEYRGGLNGLAFRTADGYAELFNALDELGVATAPGPDPEVRRCPL